MNSDKNFIDCLLSFILKSWPTRYPDKLSFYIEIIELIISSNFEKEHNLKLEKVMKKVSLLIKDSNYLVIKNNLDC